MNEYLRKWNPMSLFDNKISPIKTIETKQREYRNTINKAENIKNELNGMWCNYFGQTKNKD